MMLIRNTDLVVAPSYLDMPRLMDELEVVGCSGVPHSVTPPCASQVLPSSFHESKATQTTTMFLIPSGKRVQTKRLFCRFQGGFAYCGPKFFSTNDPVSSTGAAASKMTSLTKMLSQYTRLSRRELERMIRRGEVTLCGQVLKSPRISLCEWRDINKGDAKVKVQGKLVSINGNEHRNNPRVWAVHKLPGEVVAERDPQGRPSMVERLSIGGVGKRQGDHLKPIGRLDIPTEGLILVTNDGQFARQMELPQHRIHRVYRARVHGRLNSYKLDRIRQGFEGYKGMKVAVEKRHRRTKLSANTWLQITSVEGQVRRVLSDLYSDQILRIAQIAD
eukprot:scaffold5517_cov135-Cylindrotheca_fusiformis.AAC.49